MIVRLSLINGELREEERLFSNKFGRIRDIRQSPNGYIYFLTDAPDGKLFKINRAK